MRFSKNSAGASSADKTVAELPQICEQLQNKRRFKYYQLNLVYSCTDLLQYNIMCGIIGYTGSENSVPILVEGLKTLEYRGYDSAGIAVNFDGLTTVKKKGKLDVLKKELENRPYISANCGIGHTRWATHGEPSDVNSHPHSAEALTLVHNGIIENYHEIAEILTGNGYKMISETDTETAVKLIDMFYKSSHDKLDSIFRATKVIRGSYAFGIIFNDESDTIYAVRRDSPLIVASGNNGAFIASDIPAILKYTQSYYRLDEGVVAKLCKDEILFFNSEKQAVELKL